MRKSNTQFILTFLLRLIGFTLCLAVFAMFLPTHWMAATHRFLGLGEMPDGPLVQYLTRSISGLYAVHGGVMLVASLDVRRYRGMILYLGAASVLFGVSVTVIDLLAPLTWYWTLCEGPPTAIAGAVIFWLAKSLKEESEIGKIS
ncbi:MAG: hypothetical protein AB7N71_06860 [Phycisphaerae bacterium]